MSARTISILVAVIGVVAVTGVTCFLPASSAVAPLQVEAPREQFNICLLLDLSNRIDPALAPVQAEKDRKIITAVADQFGDLVRHKLFINSHDILRVAVAPQKTGYDATLTRVSDAMAIDLREVKIAEKRSAFPKLRQEFLNGTAELYRAAVANTSFNGSDIWSFVRDDLAAYRVTGTSAEPVRNVLIIVTDGYLTFANQERRPKSGHRTSYMSVNRFRKTGWEEEFSSGDYGLMSEGLKAAGWEVLLLEVAPRQTEDLPVLRRYWSQWFEELGVTNYRIERSQDSAKLTQGIIADFLRQPDKQKVPTPAITR